MKLLRAKRLYLPALTIVAGVLLLLVLISISTIRNLDREKKMQMDFVHRRGLTLLRALEAGARAGMTMPMWGEDAIARLIRETGRDEEIAYIYMVDRSGMVDHHSTPSLEGTPADWYPQFDEEWEIASHLRQLDDGSQVYDMAKRFNPNQPDRGMGQSHHMMRFHEHKDTIIVIGLSMRAYETARRADLHHALLMAGIVAALGSGALFFIFVIQNYYLVGKTLTQTQDYTRQVISNMADGLLGLDSKGGIVSYNELALDLLGLKESDLRNVDLARILDFKETGIGETLNHCRPVYNREVRYYRNSREVVPLSFSVKPMNAENGRCNGAVVVIRDLREIKRLEEKVRVSEKLAALGSLAASVAHEIRNPLSSIKGFAQLFREQFKPGSNEREYAVIMAKEVDRINAVINDLLTFARPIAADPVPTDVGALIDHSAHLLAADARSQGVAILNKTAPGLKDVMLDPNQMTQAFLNLILNALNAVKKDGTIEVAAEPDDTAKNLLIRVLDDGPGIEAEHLTSIFDPFFTTREKGTGLGLAIVKKIVENHGGTISVESPPPGGKIGTCFTIRIPKES
jgi:two-component system, NtrC family, sensor histidine kinase HydH